MYHLTNGIIVLEAIPAEPQTKDSHKLVDIYYNYTTTAYIF